MNDPCDVSAPTITGPTVFCGIAHPVYTASSINATAYFWTVPAAITIVSGQGTSSITTTMSNTSIGDSLLTISCSAQINNECPFGTATTYTVSKKPITSPITGPTNICGNTSATYTTAAAVGATSYHWSVPAGMTITGGAGTTSVTVSIASSFIIGTVRVYAVNACGNGFVTGTSLLVSGKVPPSTITGPANVCGMTTATYSCNTVSNATSYTWAVPNGWAITSGQGSTMILATMPANVNSININGAVKVVAVSACGNSAAKSMTVTYCHSPIAMNNGTEAEQNNISSIYPNPTSLEFTIDIASDVQNDVIIEVYDILGNKVIQQKHQIVIGDNTMKTNIEDYKAGMYFVRLIDVDNNVLYTQRVIKQ